jgi:hypothetical protein
MRVSHIPKNCNRQNDDQSSTSTAERYPFGIVRLSWAMITRHLGIVQAFSSLTVERNVGVSKDIIDQRVHRRFFEPAPLARLATKRCGSPDFFDEEVRNINTAVLTTQELARYTLALDLVASICNAVCVIAWFRLRYAAVETTVKRLLLSCPELEGTRRSRIVTAESHLGRSVWKHVQNLAVGNVTHLVIAKYCLSSSITSHICYRVVVKTITDSTGEGKAHASSVSLTYIAVDATPAFFTLAWFAASEGPVIAVRERVTLRGETIYSTPARGALALAVILVAIAKLAAGERREEAIKTRRTFIYQVGRGQ